MKADHLPFTLKVQINLRIETHTPTHYIDLEKCVKNCLGTIRNLSSVTHPIIDDIRTTVFDPIFLIKSALGNLGFMYL